MRVDLPEPDGPMTATYSPSEMVRLDAAERRDGDGAGPVDLGHPLQLDHHAVRRPRRGSDVGGCGHPPPPLLRAADATATAGEPSGREAAAAEPAGAAEPAEASAGATEEPAARAARAALERHHPLEHLVARP